MSMKSQPIWSISHRLDCYNPPFLMSVIAMMQLQIKEHCLNTYTEARYCRPVGNSSIHNAKLVHFLCLIFPYTNVHQHPSSFVKLDIGTTEFGFKKLKLTPLAKKQACTIPLYPISYIICEI